VTVGNLTRVSGFMGMKRRACSLAITDRRITCAELSIQSREMICKEPNDPFPLLRHDYRKDRLT
jgi:hypothetical protein